MLFLRCVTLRDWEFAMKQLILAVMLAITVGVAFVAYSGVTANAGANCLRADAPADQIP
jgi:hypothetical protein